MTAGIMARNPILQVAKREYQIFRWKLAVGDTSLLLGCACKSDIYYLPDQVSVYRITTRGAMATNHDRVFLDSSIIRLFFARIALDCSYSEMPTIFIEQHFRFFITNLIGKSVGFKIKAFWNLGKVNLLRKVLVTFRFMPMWMCGILGCVNIFVRKGLTIWWKVIPRPKLSSKLLNEYAKQGAVIC